MRIDKKNFDAAILSVWGHLLDQVKDVDLPDPVGWQILVLQYVRPEKVGSIIVAEASKKEDKWQGRCGIVLALGPDAYQDRDRYPEKPWCAVGDSIAWANLDSAATRIEYAGVVLATITEDRVVMRNVDPRKVS